MDDFQPATVWTDDEDLEVSEEQNEALQNKVPNWAKCPSQIGTVIEIKKLLGDRKADTLAPNVLAHRETIGFSSSNQKGGVSNIVFNRHQPVALVCYKDKTRGYCNLFQVDGENNHLIHTITFDKFPVTNAVFLDLKRFVVISDRHSCFHMYNLETGIKKRYFTKDQKTGAPKLKRAIVSPNEKQVAFVSDANEIYLYNAGSCTLVTTVTAPVIVKDAAFNVSSTELFVYCSNGYVYTYDTTRLIFTSKFYDDGCVEGMRIAVSPNAKYIACGSTSGIVNLYDILDLEGDNPRPIKTFKKLLTKITSLEFNSTSDILFMGSSDVLGATRMAHINTLEVFQNYPAPQGTPKPIYGAQFSPGSAYLALVKPRKIELIRLKHFGSY